MSLSSQLNTKSSPASVWFETHTDRKAIRTFVQEVNDLLADRDVFVVKGGDSRSHLSLVGTTFDYLFRWNLGPFDPFDIVAMNGARIGPSMPWAEEMPFVIEKAVQNGNSNPSDRAKNAVILSWFEQHYRSGYIPPVLEEFANRRSLNADDVLQTLYSRIPDRVVEDVNGLMDTVPNVWGADLKLSFILNPTFEGSLDVGGADADWIVDNTLYDCKCVRKQRPFGRRLLLQGLGYVLLDYHDQYQISRVGWYFTRHQMRIRYPLADVLKRVFDSDDLAFLREDFAMSIRSVTKNMEAFHFTKDYIKISPYHRRRIEITHFMWEAIEDNPVGWWLQILQALQQHFGCDVPQALETWGRDIQPIPDLSEVYPQELDAPGWHIETYHYPTSLKLDEPPVLKYPPEAKNISENLHILIESFVAIDPGYTSKDAYWHVDVLVESG